MGNISYIVTKANLKPERVRKVLDDVNREVFDGLLKIEEEYEGGWSFEVEGVRGYWGVQIMSPRKLGGKHPRGGDLVRFVWTKWQIEVAHRLKARIGDDGIPNPNWEPEVGKYETYLDYLRTWLEGPVANKAVLTFYAGRYNVECLSTPKRVRRMLGFTRPILPGDLRTDAEID